MSNSNPYQRAARLAKATKLADFLEAGGITAEDACRATPETLRLAAEGAGVKLPSQETWQEVINLLQARQIARERIKAAGGIVTEVKSK